MLTAVLIILAKWWLSGLILYVWHRLRQQIDSYGATVGDLVDYVEKKEGEK